MQQINAKRGVVWYAAHKFSPQQAVQFGTSKSTVSTKSPLLL